VKTKQYLDDEALLKMSVPLGGEENGEDEKVKADEEGGEDEAPWSPSWADDSSEAPPTTTRRPVVFPLIPASVNEPIENRSPEIWHYMFGSSDQDSECIRVLQSLAETRECFMKLQRRRS
jgi:hypothetical protein